MIKIWEGLPLQLLLRVPGIINWAVWKQELNNVCMVNTRRRTGYWSRKFRVLLTVSGCTVMTSGWWALLPAGVVVSGAPLGIPGAAADTAVCTPAAVTSGMGTEPPPLLVSGGLTVKPSLDVLRLPLIWLGTWGVSFLSASATIQIRSFSLPHNYFVIRISLYIQIDRNNELFYVNMKNFDMFDNSQTTTMRTIKS